VARPINCDNGHAEPIDAAYMITDMASGDVIALCPGCMVDFAAGICRGWGLVVAPPELVNAAVLAQGDPPAPIVDAPLPEDDAGATVEPGELAREMRDEFATAYTLRPDPLVGEAVIVARPEPQPETTHRARTRRRLAARPDSAATSEAVVGWDDLGSAATD